jgi:hypothetical protein
MDYFIHSDFDREVSESDQTWPATDRALTPALALVLVYHQAYLSLLLSSPLLPLFSLLYFPKVSFLLPFLSLSLFFFLLRFSSLGSFTKINHLDQPELADLHDLLPAPHSNRNCVRKVTLPSLYTYNNPQGLHLAHTIFGNS